MERADHLYGGLTNVACRLCGACVKVRKHSAQHTNVQWTSDAVRTCVEFKGRESAFIPTCSNLRDSIEVAVTQGRVRVPDG